MRSVNGSKFERIVPENNVGVCGIIPEVAKKVMSKKVCQKKFVKKSLSKKVCQKKFVKKRENEVSLNRRVDPK